MVGVAIGVLATIFAAWFTFWLEARHTRVREMRAREEEIARLRNVLRTEATGIGLNGHVMAKRLAAAAKLMERRRFRQVSAQLPFASPMVYPAVVGSLGLLDRDDPKKRD